VRFYLSFNKIPAFGIFLITYCCLWELFENCDWKMVSRENCSKENSEKYQLISSLQSGLKN
jgi:hypothetical protein